MSNETIYKMIWKNDSPNPGFIESLSFKESELPDHNREEVLGPFREYVVAPPDSQLYKLFVTNNNSPDPALTNIIISDCRWNWETNDVDIVYLPDLEWDDIRLARNRMLAASDNHFNEDTPDPLKSEWVEHRALLRDLITREKAAGRTPGTVFWNDYVPPFPPCARIGVPEDIKPNCVWYKGEDTYPPQAIIGSPESLAAHEEFLASIVTPPKE